MESRTRGNEQQTGERRKFPKSFQKSVLTSHSAGHVASVIMIKTSIFVIIVARPRAMLRCRHKPTNAIRFRRERASRLAASRDTPRETRAAPS